MKRLVSLLLVICMLVPCFAFAEQIDDSVLVESSDDVFADVPDEIVQDEVELELELPADDGLIMMPTTEVDGPDPYRELVLLQPTDLHGDTLDVNTVRLSWGPVAFATQYDVYRKLLGESEYTRIASTPSNQTYFEDTVVPGVVAYYRVQALNVSYNGDEPVLTYSPQSNTLPYITLEAPKLSDPRGLDADTVRLNWGRVSGANSFEVEMTTVEGTAFTEVRKDLTGFLCNVDNLEPGQGYYFRVRAVRTFSSGEKFYSDYSNIGCGTPMDRPTLTVTADGSNAVLSWSAASGATGYVIYRKVGASGGYSKLAVVGDVTSYVDAGLSAGDVCYYYVYALCPVGDYNCFSLSSATRYFTIVDAVELCAVQNTGTQEQTIDWVAHAKGANKYLVYASTTMDGLYTQIGETTETKYIATGLEPGRTYYYKVRAVREFSNGDVSYGPWSNIMSMPEAGGLVLSNLNATNLTYAALSGGKDISGGYVGDTFGWNVTVAGGSGEYAFKYSLVSLNGAGTIVLQDYKDGYTAIPDGEISLTDNFSFTLTDAHVSLINDQKYAMQVEVRDSLGSVATLIACEDTYKEMNFAAAKPTTRMINVTLRAGQTLTLDHGVCPEAGDKVLMDVSNPTGAVMVLGNEVTAVSNGYATILVTPARFTNDILIAYNITVGYATLAVTNVTPSATTMNNYGTLSWDVAFTGGRSPYTINFKVYRDDVLIANDTRSQSATGSLSVNYQPTVAGSYALEVTITSSDNQSVTKRSAVTKVVEYTPVTVMPSVTTAKTGTNIAWVTTYSGSSTVVRRDYTLFRDGVAVSSSVGTNSFTFNYTPTVAGSYVLKVIVYEKDGNRIEVTSSTVTVTQGAPVGSVEGTVTGTRVAMREGNGTSYAVITRIDKYETVNVISKKGSWYYIEYNGRYGYMMDKYIALK